MSIAEKLKQNYLDRLSGELESRFIDEIKDTVYWKPLTGKQQKQIQTFAEKSTAEGICMHVKTRALDKKGDLIFKEIGITSLMHDYGFELLSKIFFAMTGTEFDSEDIEKN